MINEIFWAIGILSVVVSIFFMLKVRRAGAADLAMADGLTGGEWAIVLITMLLGSFLLPGLIYYFGWKKRFPRKARPIGIIVLVFVGIVLLFVAVSGYGIYKLFIGSKGLNDVQIPVVAPIVQTQETQTATNNDKPVSVAASATVNTKDGYQIMLPDSWSKTNEMFNQSGTTADITWYAGPGQAGNSISYSSVTIFAGSANSEQFNASLDQAHGSDASKSGYTEQTITIPGARKATLVTYTDSGSDLVSLYVYGQSRNYRVAGETNAGDSYYQALIGIIKTFKSL